MSINTNMKPMHGNLDSIVHWKSNPDKFQDSDNFSGMGDQSSDWDEFGKSPTLTGSPKSVNFISKDETNAASFRHMKMKRWF